MSLKSAVIDDATCDPEGGLAPPRTGLTPDALPEASTPVVAENSQTGVSTEYALSATPPTPEAPKITRKGEAHWYVLRATYGRTKDCYEYLVEHGIEAYHPTIRVYRMVDGKRKKVEESRLPNLFFAHGTKEALQTFVYDNVNLPHLRFYYRRTGLGSDIKPEPLIVPDHQMKSLKIICAQEEADKIIVPASDHHFENGDTVIVTGGDFKGVIGKVARYCKQPRVGVIIDSFLTIATAYVPRGYLKPYTPNDKT